MSEPMMMEGQGQVPEAHAPVATPQKFRIKRVGARPMQFEGSELGMAMSFSPANEYWYEVNIYRTVESRFVLAIRLFYQSDDNQDTAKAWECESFGQVMDHLEAYDAAQDIQVKIAPEDLSLSLPELAARAMGFQAEAEAARLQFRGLVGEILHELEQ
ncbi:MAG: hypothetical protein AAGB10_20920 [Pseudomonadota bacterium]